MCGVRVEVDTQRDWSLYMLSSIVGLQCVQKARQLIFETIKVSTELNAIM